MQSTAARAAVRAGEACADRSGRARITLRLPAGGDAPRVREAKELVNASGLPPEPALVNWAMRMIEDRDAWSNRRKNR